MTKFIAERNLLYSKKGRDEKHKFVIRIGTPYTVNQDMVNFPIGEGLVGCHIETSGLDEEFAHEAYGVDGLQALEIASNIDPYLKRLSKKFDLFWPNGEAYYDE